MHQLPSQPSNLRVRTWRRLQQLGALAVKQSVYVLPDSPSAREDFEWLKAEIDGAGGEAMVFSAGSVDAWSDDAIVEQFRRSGQETYGGLAQEIERVLSRLGRTRARRTGRAPAMHRLLDLFRQRLVSADRVDFFGSAGRDRVVTLLDTLQARASAGSRRPSSDAPAGGSTGETFHGRLWVTRPRPGVDRMSSAWLIRRFIDPDARFDFVPDRHAAPRDGVPFDMFGVTLSHQGERCTFETLAGTFGVTDAAVDRMAAIVHDLDLKDARFGAPEAPTVAAVIDGLQLAFDDDHVLLAQGMALFDALYRSFQAAARRAGPRRVARAHPSRSAVKKPPRTRRR